MVVSVVYTSTKRVQSDNRQSVRLKIQVSVAHRPMQLVSTQFVLPGVMSSYHTYLLYMHTDDVSPFTCIEGSMGYNYIGDCHGWVLPRLVDDATPLTTPPNGAIGLSGEGLQPGASGAAIVMTVVYLRRRHWP